MSSEEMLKEIAAEVSICSRCDLCKGRTKAVPGEGSPHAKILFIGEGPGFHEDRQGRPFVGPSGQFLEELLKSIGLKRSDVFITNVVKCRPPENRDPLPVEINACDDYLERQIAALKPLVIVTLGRVSMAKFFGGEKISVIHGRPRKKDGYVCIPMFHPAAALRTSIGEFLCSCRFLSPGSKKIALTSTNTMLRHYCKFKIPRKQRGCTEALLQYSLVACEGS